MTLADADTAGSGNTLLHREALHAITQLQENMKPRTKEAQCTWPQLSQTQAETGGLGDHQDADALCEGLKELASQWIVGAADQETSWRPWRAAPWLIVQRVPSMVLSACISGAIAAVVDNPSARLNIQVTHWPDDDLEGETFQTLIDAMEKSVIGCFDVDMCEGAKARHSEGRTDREKHAVEVLTSTVDLRYRGLFGAALGKSTLKRPCRFDLQGISVETASLLLLKAWQGSAREPLRIRCMLARDSRGGGGLSLRMNDRGELCLRCWLSDDARLKELQDLQATVRSQHSIHLQFVCELLGRTCLQHVKMCERLPDSVRIHIRESVENKEVCQEVERVVSSGELGSSHIEEVLVSSGKVGLSEANHLLLMVIMALADNPRVSTLRILPDWEKHRDWDDLDEDEVDFLEERLQENLQLVKVSFVFFAGFWSHCTDWEPNFITRNMVKLRLLVTLPRTLSSGVDERILSYLSDLFDEDQQRRILSERERFTFLNHLPVCATQLDARGVTPLTIMVAPHWNALFMSRPTHDILG